ncbi:MAG: GDP-L-fucose synthase [Actinomycetota bacterium]|nr:GDP-L-fucose synthase [Actinomycetota bacterium]
MTFEHDAPIFVAGHQGLVGSAIVRRLASDGFGNVLTATRTDLDLRDANAVVTWFREARPKLVYLVAGLGGGIMANAATPADFLFDNLQVHTSVLRGVLAVDSVRKLLYVSPSTVYPRQAVQPITEDQLLTGPLEPSMRPYALAKIAGLEMCETVRRQYGRNFVSAVSTNVYGPGDSFDVDTGNVIPALMRRLHDAKTEGRDHIDVWGTGSSMRDFMHVDDLARAAVFLMERYDSHGHINIGTGSDLSIRTVAEMIRDVVHPEATLRFDHTRPDGVPRMLLDASRITRMGWAPEHSLEDGLRSTYEWFRSIYGQGSGSVDRAGW